MIALGGGEMDMYSNDRSNRTSLKPERRSSVRKSLKSHKEENEASEDLQGDKIFS